MGAIAERYRAVRRRIEDAADVVGRDPRAVRIVAVSKTVGPDEISQAIAAGIRDLGENRAQEFIGKHALFPEVDWHFVGTLQTNKARMVVGKASLIHSVDSVRLLREIDKRAREAGVVQSVLLQVNVLGEKTKHGLDPDRLEETLASAGDLGAVRVEGLMTMAPLGRPEEAREAFRGLAGLFARFEGMRFNGVDLRELSMGMTNDFEIAVEEGATIVRIGRAIFGR